VKLRENEMLMTSMETNTRMIEHMKFQLEANRQEKEKLSEYMTVKLPEVFNRVYSRRLVEQRIKELEALIKSLETNTLVASKS